MANDKRDRKKKGGGRGRESDLVENVAVDGTFPDEGIDKLVPIV